MSFYEEKSDFLFSKDSLEETKKHFYQEGKGRNMKLWPKCPSEFDCDRFEDHDPDPEVSQEQVHVMRAAHDCLDVFCQGSVFCP